MKNALNTTFAALVAASAVLGGASAALAGGSYYEGASATPIERVAVPRTGAAVIVPEVQSGGDGDYYAGIERDGLDRISTGSITNGVSAGATPAVQTGGDGEYYQGLNRR